MTAQSGLSMCDCHVVFNRKSKAHIIFIFIFVSTEDWPAAGRCQPLANDRH